MVNVANRNDMRATPDASLSQQRWFVRFGWLLPVVIVFAVYHVAIDNYFTSDDFMWLDRARTFRQDWLQIFRSDVAYFDPLVHLLFVTDYLVAGHDPRWYHCVDLAIHAANALLVYRFARLLSDNERVAIYSGVLFAGSFAIADAVLWSSSRVDLLSTFFFMCALIRFLDFLRGGSRRDLILSFLLFVLALGAKGTPLILPLVLFWLIIQEKKSLRFAVHLIPFGITTVTYLALLKYTEHLAAIPVKMFFNVRNVALAFCSLFIPGHTLTHLNLTVTAIVLIIAITALGLLALSFRSTITLRRTGYFILLASILPVLVIDELVLITKQSNFIDLMGSPSHRIYLASVGAAFLAGGVLRSIEIHLGKFVPRFALPTVSMLLVAATMANAHLVRERDDLWEAEGDKARTAVEFFDSYKGNVVEDSLIGLIGFPHTTRAFMEATIKEHLGVKDATFNHYVDIGLLVDAKTLEKAEKSYLFIFGRDEHIYDRSPLYRQQLILSKRAINDFGNLENLLEAQAVTGNLIREINRIIDINKP